MKTELMLVEVFGAERVYILSVCRMVHLVRINRAIRMLLLAKGHSCSNSNTTGANVSKHIEHSLSCVCPIFFWVKDAAAYSERNYYGTLNYLFSRMHAPDSTPTGTS